MKKSNLVGALVVGVLTFGVAIVISTTGVINVAADEPLPGWVEAILHLSMERSVAVRASDIAVPDLNDPDLVAEGAEHYDAMCVGCHGAPGVEPGEIATGLSPPPPELARITETDPATLFWVTKHGVMMTGMPAWGLTHDDAKIWGMVALMNRFSAMTAAQYSALVEEASGHGEHDHGSHAHGSHAHAH